MRGRVSFWLSVGYLLAGNLLGQSAERDESARLPPPRRVEPAVEAIPLPVAPPVAMPLPWPPPVFYRSSAYDVWQFSAPAQTNLGFYRPRVVPGPYGPYYLYSGQPYFLLSVQPRRIYPTISGTPYR